MQQVDLFVIGGGSGGVRAARVAASHGASVMLAEEFRTGGTCVIRGCVPKKLMVYASQFGEAFDDARGFGWDAEVKGFDWNKLVAAKEKEITRLEGIYGTNLEKAGVKLVHQRAVVVDPNKVRLADGTEISAKHILIATGAKPFVDQSVKGYQHAITSNEVFDLETFPKRLCIVGGGYIAVEFAGVFAGLGAKVTLVYRGEKLLRGFDEDLRDHLMAEYAKKGIRLVMNEHLAAIEAQNEAFSLTFRNGHEPIQADQVLMATGRVPNSSSLGLEEAGVQLGDKGEVLVDRASQTSCPSIFAVGDVTDRVNLTPVAIREGHAFADSQFGNKPWTVDHSLIPTAVFSEPEIGTVGISEAQALKSGRAIDIYKSSFRAMKHTLSGRDTRTFMKLIVDSESDKVLGVHLCGEGSGEMIQMVGIAVKMGATKAQFDATMAVHPTAAEELVTMRTPTVRHAVSV